MATVEAVPMVADRLSPIERHWRDLVWLRGIGATLLGAGSPLALWLIVDLFVNLPGVVRLTGLMCTIVLGFWQLWHRLIVPLWRGIEPADVAGWVEQAEPRLQERLLTCLELEQADAPPSRAGRLMQRQVRKETFLLLNELNVTAALPSDRAYTTLGRGLLMAAVTIAPFAIWMTGYGLAWQRMVVPFGNWGWGRDFRIVADGGDGVVARGSDAVIRVKVTPRRGGVAIPEQLTLAWRSTGESGWDERRLPWSASDEAFVATLPRLTNDTEFVVTGPASESPRYHLRVVDPPRLVSLIAAVDPPAYTGRSSQYGEVGSELETYGGSRVHLQARFDRAVATVEVDWPTGRVAGADSLDTEVQTRDFLLSQDPADWKRFGRHQVANVAATADVSGMFVVRWHSPEGFVVEEPPRRLIVIPDQPPQVRLEGAATVTAQPDERHRLQITASDDYGFTDAELSIELAPGDRRLVGLPRDPQAALQYNWPWTIDLSDLGVKSGQAISLRARVVDNREVPTPQERWSEPQVVVVSTSAPAAETRELAEQTQSAREELRQLMQELAELRKELREIHQKTAAATVRQSDAEQLKRLENLRSREAELNAEFDAWKDRLPTDGAWDQVAESAQELRDDELAQAQSELEKAQEAEPRDSIAAMSRALDELAAAQKALQQLDDDIRALGNLGDELGELAKLANRSERLAEVLERPVAATGNDGAAAEQLAAAALEAEQLQQALEQLLNEQPALREALEEFQRQQAGESALLADQLARQQRNLADAIQQALDNAAAPAANPDDQAANFQQGSQLAQQAQELAADAEDFAGQVGQSNAATPEARQAAVRTAEQFQALADATEQGNFAAANVAADTAAEELADAQQTVPPSESDAQGAASELARGLNELQEALQQMTATAETQRGALAAGQQQLQQATAQLAQRAAQPQQTPASEPGMPSAGQEATAALNAAQSAMANSQQALQPGAPGSPAEPAQAAADQLEQAAQALAAAAEADGSQSPLPAQAGAAIADASSRLQAGQQRLQAQAQALAGNSSTSSGNQNPGGQPGTSMPKASQPSEAQTPDAPPAGSEAGTGKSGSPAQDAEGHEASGTGTAAADYRNAAEALRRAARSANGNAPSMAQQSRSQAQAAGKGGTQPNDVAAPAAAGSLAGATERLQSGTPRSWGRLGGALKTDLLDGSPMASHPEYARQIQRYFETIARDPAGAPSANGVTP